MVLVTSAEVVDMDDKTERALLRSEEAAMSPHSVNATRLDTSVVSSSNVERVKVFNTDQPGLTT